MQIKPFFVSFQVHCLIKLYYKLILLKERSRINNGEQVRDLILIQLTTSYTFFITRVAK